MSPTRKSLIRESSGHKTNGYTLKDQQPSDQQQQMPNDHDPAEMLPDGNVPWRPQEQPFVRSPLLHPPPHIERMLQQQRGYVEEMFRQQHEVVQRQLAEIQHQQLEFMQRQHHLLRNIIAAVDGQFSPHPEAQQCTKTSHTGRNRDSAEEVEPKQQLNNASSIEEVDVNTGSVCGRRKFAPIVNNKSAAVNLDTGSIIIEASIGTGRTIGGQPVSTSSTVAESAAGKLLESAEHFRCEMSVGGWTFVGLARATREQLLGCGTTESFGLSFLPVSSISYQGDNTSAHCEVKDKNMISGFYVNKEMAADKESVPRIIEPGTHVPCQSMGSAQKRLKQDSIFSPVADPKRSPVEREEVVGRLVESCRHTQPSGKAPREASQQLIQTKLAGLLIYGLADDIEGLCQDRYAVQEIGAGRKGVEQALSCCLKAFGSTLGYQNVSGAPPSEAIERIRTKLEFEPPPPSTQTSSAHASEPTKWSDFGKSAVCESVDRVPIDVRWPTQLHGDRVLR